jgi:hypothetical protein
MCILFKLKPVQHLATRDVGCLTSINAEFRFGKLFALAGFWHPPVHFMGPSVKLLATDFFFQILAHPVFKM